MKEVDAFGQEIHEGDRVTIQRGEHIGCTGTVKRVHRFSSGECEYYVQLDLAIPHLIDQLTKCRTSS